MLAAYLLLISLLYTPYSLEYAHPRPVKLSTLEQNDAYYNEYMYRYIFHILLKQGS